MTLQLLGSHHTVRYPVGPGGVAQGMALRTLAPGETQPYVADLTDLLGSMRRTIGTVAVLIDPALGGGAVQHDDTRVAFEVAAPSGSAGDRVVEIRLGLVPDGAVVWTLVQRVVGPDPSIPDDAVTLGSQVVTTAFQPVELSALQPLSGGATFGDGLLTMRGGVLGLTSPALGGGGLNQTASEVAFPQSQPSATWTITHNLGRHPQPRVVTTSGDLVDCAANYPDANTVVLTFAAPFAGTAYL